MKRLCLFLFLVAIAVCTISCSPSQIISGVGYGIKADKMISGEKTEQKPEKEIIRNEKGEIIKIIYHRK